MNTIERLSFGEEPVLNDELLFDPRVNGQEDSTKSERIAWYVYDWANSVYSTVALAGFLPLLVSFMAENVIDANPDVTLADGETGCVSWITSSSGNQDDISFTCVPPASIASAFISVSSLFQLVAFVLASPLADYGSSRKRYLVITGSAGAILTILFVVIPDSGYLIAGWNIVLSNVFFGVSIVFYNSFLSTIVVNDPRIKKIQDPLAKEHAAEQLMNQLSGIGFASGYASGVLLLLVSLVLASIVPEEEITTFFRISMVLTGGWWLGFGCWTYLKLTNRPLPEMPADESRLTLGVRRVVKTIMRMPGSLPNTGRFIIGWFIYSDGVFTVSQVGSLFAAGELNFGTGLLVPLLIVIPLAALLGNFFFLWVYRKWDLTGKQMIIFHHYAFLFLPIYMFIGFIPGSPIGMIPPTGDDAPSGIAIAEMYLFGAYYGLQLGSIQSFSRTTFADLVPPGLDAEFFGLYEITDKGSSWMGPIVAAWLFALFGSMRYAMIFIMLQVLLSLAVLSPLDVVKGRRDAKSYAFSHHTDPGRELSKSMSAKA